MVKKIMRSWVFIIAVVIALLGAASFWFPYLGIPIAVLTLISAGLQGYQNQRTQEDINTKHAHALNQIQTTQDDLSVKHAQAMQEIAQAKEEAADQHADALREIDQARSEAARQYDEAEQAIKKARDEARAENILLDANKFATSIMEKDARVNEAITLYPDFRQRELKQLGLEMSAAVIDNVDFIKQMYLRAAGYPFDPPYSESRLDDEERAYFTDHAILYLSETVLHPANQDAQGLLYLACIYGYCHQYEEMTMVLDKASQFSSIVQVIKAEFRERSMILILVGACGSDQIKIDRLRETLQLPETTEQFFCNYILEVHLLNPNYQHGEYIKWVAVKRPDAPGINGRTVIMISPVYPSDAGTAYAYFLRPNGTQEFIVPMDKKIPIEELYRLLSSLYILFCPIA